MGVDGWGNARRKVRRAWPRPARQFNSDPVWNNMRLGVLGQPERQMLAIGADVDAWCDCPGTSAYRCL